MSASGLEAGTYDLVTTSLVDEHLSDLRPLYRESARLACSGAVHVVVGFHPFFIMKAGMPTHFDGPDGQPVAIQTHVHLFSEHVKAALQAGWSLAEMHEQVIDERWIAKKPKWEVYQDVPVSFLAVWRRQSAVGFFEPDSQLFFRPHGLQVQHKCGTSPPLEEETNMNNDRKIDELNDSAAPVAEVKKPETDNSDSEFQITVRKLEMPVQPRGVLAE